MTKKPKILFWDIETSLLTVTTFTLYPNSIPHGGIIHDWYIICAAWKEAGSKKVESVTITKPGDDYAVVKKLRQVLEDVDILVHHNGDRFDIKKFNARLIYHKLPPLPKIQTVDTLKATKKIAAFTSNRLDYLTKTLVGHGKMHTTPGLWLDCMEGNKKALKQMTEYNKVDVIRLEEYYNRILPYMSTHPHVGVLKGYDKNMTCPKCGGHHLATSKIRVTAAGVRKRQLQCKDCGSYTTIPIKL